MTRDEEQARRWTEPSPYWVAVSEETRERMKHVSPSAERNVGPIAGVLAPRLPDRGRVLEVASGTGQHVAAFARRFSGLIWIPSDPHPAARASIEAWVAESGLTNVEPPRDLDVTAPDWMKAAPAPLDAVVAINLLHIAPWEASLGLLQGAAGLLKPDGSLFVYGCFRRGGRHLSESNLEFDRSLRHRDPHWGVRDVETVAKAAEAVGLALRDVVDMPANNLLLVFVLKTVALGKET